jgi:threonine/homoserine/homoserine lactone efflux protein
MYIESHLIISYFVAITLLSMTPGVDTMLVIRNTARGGWRDGITSSFGICSVLFFHASISALGISVILLKTAWAFSFLKLAGAGYIIWLGIGSFRKLWKGSTPQYQIQGSDSDSSSFKLARSLREGMLSNLLNPKAVIFYMAFLPQFINPQHSAWIQSMVLAACHFLIAMLWQSLLALIVDKAKQLQLRPIFGQIFDGLTGTVLVALGLKLALDN